MKRLEVPIGSQFGFWSTVSVQYSEASSGPIGQIKSYIDVVCKCGDIYKKRGFASITNGSSVGCRKCALTRRPSGLEYKRNPNITTRASFRIILETLPTSNLCAWCCRKLGATSHIDHNPRCPHRNHRACRRCVRGLVHPSCNWEIIGWDFAHSHGLGPIPLERTAYLRMGDPDTPWVGPVYESEFWRINGESELSTANLDRSPI